MFFLASDSPLLLQMLLPLTVSSNAAHGAAVANLRLSIRQPT